MTGPFSWSIWASTWPNFNHSSVHIYGLAVALKISNNTDPDIDVFYIPRAAFPRPVGAMHAGGQGGSNKQKRRRRRRKVSNTKPLQIKEETRSPSLAPTLYPSNLLCSQLPAPAIRRGATGGHIGAIFRSHGPLFLATAFKVLHCDVHGLDVCLVPYMQSYHYPCLLTIAGPVFVTSAALRLGLWHDCTVDLFSFTYRSPCLSLFLFFCTQTVYHVWIQLWSDDLENLLPLKACVTPLPLWCVWQLSR